MKTFNINISVKINPSFQNMELAEARIIAEIIRSKIRKELDNNMNVVQWQIDLPNERVKD